jgi:predicted transposase YdaD
MYRWSRERWQSQQREEMRREGRLSLKHASLIKEAFPRSILAEEALDAGRMSIQQVLQKTSGWTDTVLR